jgi:hypothetical protein
MGVIVTLLPSQHGHKGAAAGLPDRIDPEVFEKCRAMQDLVLPENPA